MKFSKMQSLGNDFVVINALRESFDLDASGIQALSDRHLGIGFDQLLVLAPSTDPLADFDYLIFNADGSRVTQCGNGARCLAGFIKKNRLSDKQTFILNTSADCLEVSCLNDKFARLVVNRFDLLQSIFQFELDGQSFSGAIIDIGNPHLVLFGYTVDDAMIDSMGAFLQSHAAFPEGVNVNFASIDDQKNIRLRVYERGVGQTLACGSGAMATAMVGMLKKLINNSVMVQQPGGDLTVTYWKDKHQVCLDGPIAHVFDGEVTQ